MLPILCRACIHAKRVPIAGTEPEPGADGAVAIPSCTAYPGGLPFDIATGADHHQPRGDEVGGLVFSLAYGSAARDALGSWQEFSAK